MVSREGGGMDALGRGTGRGGAPAPAYSLRWPEIFPPEGVGFRPERHSAHQGGIPTGVGGLGEILPPGPFQWRHSRIPFARDHPPGSQAGGDGNSKPDFVCLG